MRASCSPDDRRRERRHCALPLVRTRAAGARRPDDGLRPQGDQGALRARSQEVRCVQGPEAVAGHPELRRQRRRRLRAPYLSWRPTPQPPRASLLSFLAHDTILSCQVTRGGLRMALRTRWAALGVVAAVSAIAVSGSVATAGGDGAAKAALRAGGRQQDTPQVDPGGRTRSHALSLLVGLSQQAHVLQRRAIPLLQGVASAAHEGARMPGQEGRRRCSASQSAPTELLRSPTTGILCTRTQVRPSSRSRPTRSPGDVNGQAFLGIWFTVAPSGKQVTH